MMELSAFRNDTPLHQDATRVARSFLAFDCVVLTLTSVLGLLGNLLVCWVVSRNKSLQTSHNALLVSLAASDLLRCSVDAPLLLSSFLLCHGGVEAHTSWACVSLCSVQRLSSALCSCVQLLTLVGISVERFHAIAFPFRLSERRKEARIRVWILASWVCGVTLAVISVALSSKGAPFHTPRSGYASEDNPPQYSDPFGVYVLVPVWGCSLTLIVVYYVRIFKVVRRHGKRVFDSGVQLRSSTSGQVRGWLSFSAAAQRIGARRAHSSLSCVTRTGRTVVTVVTVAEAAGSAAAVRPPEIVGAVCLLTPFARERGKKRLEGKLAQRFGYIILVFTAFWMPMVLCLLLNITSWKDRIPFIVELEMSAVVLTCVPAAVDPLIYTMVTRQFCSEFSKILSSLPGCPLKLRA